MHKHKTVASMHKTMASMQRGAVHADAVSILQRYPTRRKSETSMYICIEMSPPTRENHRIESTISTYIHIVTF